MRKKWRPFCVPNASSVRISCATHIPVDLNQRAPRRSTPQQLVHALQKKCVSPPRHGSSSTHLRNARYFHAVFFSIDLFICSKNFPIPRRVIINAGYIFSACESLCNRHYVVCAHPPGQAVHGIHGARAWATAPPRWIPGSAVMSFIFQITA